jgi:hypothetical protein
MDHMDVKKEYKGSVMASLQDHPSVVEEQHGITLSFKNSLELLC